MTIILIPFRKSVPDANALNLMHFIHWMHNYLIDPQFRKGTMIIKSGYRIWNHIEDGSVDDKIDVNEIIDAIKIDFKKGKFAYL